MKKYFSFLIILILIIISCVNVRAQNHNISIIGNKFYIYQNQNTNVMNGDFVGGVAKYFIGPIPLNSYLTLEFNNSGPLDVGVSHTSGPMIIACTTDPNINIGTTPVSNNYSFIGNTIPYSQNSSVLSFANGSFIQSTSSNVIIPATSNFSSTFAITSPLPCASIIVQFSSIWSNPNNNANITVSGIFSTNLGPPTIFGNTNTIYGYSHQTAATAAAIKAFPGTLHTLVIGTPAAGTLSIFDLASASCTGTPATNIVAVITVPAALNPESFVMDYIFLNGICTKSSVAMDYTVSFQ